MAQVLVIDDDPIFRDLLEGQIGKIGHICDTAPDLRGGLSKVNESLYDIVFLDVQLPDGNGLEELESFKLSRSAPEIVIITGNGDPDGADLAIKNGAWDYIQKPASEGKIHFLVKRALQYREKKLESEPKREIHREKIIGESARLRSCFDLLFQCARTNSNVLITGETGTGKELFAKAIHNNSPRAGRKFIVVDCTAIPETLAESLLFGHQRGSFTGAHADRMGLFPQADGGSLFLDEVGDLPIGVQKSLLRVLQERKFRPLGSKQEHTSDFRLISDTNRNLEKMVEEGLFRKDLYFRLRTQHIPLPSLRDRLDDITILLKHYVPRICVELGLPRKKPSPEFVDALSTYDWPGNVRELVNTIQTACSNARDESMLYTHHMPLELRAHLAKQGLTWRPPEQAAPVLREAAPGRPAALEAEAAAEALTSFKNARRQAVDRMEAAYLRRLVEACSGDSRRACVMSGLSRARLYELLKKHNVYLKYRR